MTKMKLTKGQTYDLDSLRFVGWTAEGDGETDGYNWMDYFDADGRYYGPDIYGIEPLFQAAVTVYDVFRAENRRGGRADHVGTVEACDEATAQSLAEQTYECKPHQHLYVAPAPTEEETC